MKPRRGGPVKGITPFRKDKYAGGRRIGKEWIWCIRYLWQVMMQENA